MLRQCDTSIRDLESVLPRSICIDDKMYQIDLVSSVTYIDVMRRFAPEATRIRITGSVKPIQRTVSLSGLDALLLRSRGRTGRGRRINEAFVPRLDQTVEHMYVRLSSDTKQLVNVRSTIWPNTIATMSASDNPIILKISRMTIARTAHIHNHQGLYLYTFIILCSGKTMTGPESSVDSTTFKAMTASEPNTSVEICCSFGSLFLTRLCP